ncbi:MAG: methyltransferase domain-containing protein [Rhodospirillales bacterium]
MVPAVPALPRPLCPVCRARGRAPGPLAIEPGWRAADDDARTVEQGVLACGDAACGARLPVIDGVPVLVPDPDRYFAEAGVYVLARDDLDPAVADAVGRYLSGGSWYDAVRQHLSSYGRDHWGEFDPDDRDDPPCGSTGALVEAAIARAGVPDGPLAGTVVDLGCAAGGITRALADRTGGPVVGIDLSAPLARLARRALARGEVRYPRRRVGSVYDLRGFPVPRPRGSATVWIADALAVPLPDASAALVVAPNLLDCVADPAALLREIERLLMPGGMAVLTTPFDWSHAATPPPNWIGGRSIADGGTSLVTFVRQNSNLSPLVEESAVPWTVRLHDRATMTYSVRSLAVHKIVV